MDAVVPARGRIFDYLDFRPYLVERFEARKRENPALSLRYVAAKAGLDPGTLSRVLKGSRRIDSRCVGRLAQALGLAGDEKEYFENLAYFSLARSQTEKNHFYEKMLRLMGGKVQTLEEGQYEYYRNWYYVALRELINVDDFGGDPRELARRLRPAIRPDQAKRALEALLRMGLVAKDAEGRLVLTESMVTSGEAIGSMLVDNFHTAMGELALRAIQEIEPVDRGFSALTLSLSREGLRSIEAALARFRRQVLEIARRDGAADGVYQMNFQVFPLTQPLRARRSP